MASNTVLRDDNTEKDFRQVTRDIQDNEDTTTREQAIRNEQNELWQNKDSELQNALDAVDDGAKLIQNLSLGASFIQLKKKFEYVTKKMNE